MGDLRGHSRGFFSARLVGAGAGGLLLRTMIKEISFMLVIFLFGLFVCSLNVYSNCVVLLFLIEAFRMCGVAVGGGS